MLKEDLERLHFVRRSYAFILAGGRGSRLKQLTAVRCKPAVYFGGKFRIIDFVMSNCLNSGVRRMGVLTQYKSHSLLRHLQRGWTFFKSELNEFIDLMPAQQRIDENLLDELPECGKWRNARIESNCPGRLRSAANLGSRLAFSMRLYVGVQQQADHALILRVCLGRLPTEEIHALLAQCDRNLHVFVPEGEFGR